MSTYFFLVRPCISQTARYYYPILSQIVPVRVEPSGSSKLNSSPHHWRRPKEWRNEIQNGVCLSPSSNRQPCSVCQIRLFGFVSIDWVRNFRHFSSNNEPGSLHCTLDSSLMTTQFQFAHHRRQRIEEIWGFLDDPAFILFVQLTSNSCCLPVIIVATTLESWTSQFFAILP